MALLPSEKLGRYELIAKLGSGGMAEVHLARQVGVEGFTRYVAIKRMRRELTQHVEFVNLFVEEARTASLLTHPNVCQVHEFAQEDGDYFMVMEYLEGVPLTKLLIEQFKDRAAFTEPLLVALIEQACEGIHYAHEARDPDGEHYNLVHRDISPPNLFVTIGGVVKILDFGISKKRDSIVKTLTGQIRGKFAYMSPEQLQAKQLDRRSDIFSLGIVLFELLTGTRLFRRASRLKVYRAVVSETIPRVRDLCPDVPQALDDVVARALSRDRDNRFDTAREMGEALRDAMVGHGGPVVVNAISHVIRDRFSGELERGRQLMTDPMAPIPEMDLEQTRNIRRPGVAASGSQPEPAPADLTSPDADFKTKQSAVVPMPEDTTVDSIEPMPNASAADPASDDR